MAAYVVADVDVTDPTGFEEYRALAPSSIERYGGRYLVRGGRAETLEGELRPCRLVVVEFPSAEQAKRWYDSEEYQRLKAIRDRCARTDLVIVEGV